MPLFGILGFGIVNIVAVLVGGGCLFNYYQHHYQESRDNERCFFFFLLFSFFFFSFKLVTGDLVGLVTRYDYGAWEQRWEDAYGW